MFPRASNTQLLASSPTIVVSLKSSSTAAEPAVTVNQAHNTSGAGIAASAAMLFDGTNFIRIPTAGASGDGSTALYPAGGFVFNGTDWDRQRSVGAAHNTTGTGIAASAAMLFDGTNFIRIPTAGASGDGSTAIYPNALFALNGTTWDRLRNNAAANLTATTQPFNLAVAEPGEWTENSSVAATGTPSASKAAGAAGVRHVCRNVSISLANVNAAASALITFHLRDGATGAGTIKRTWQFVVPGGNTVHIDVAGLNIFGTAATAMTLESAAALPADVSGVAAIGGYSTI